jgi:uncharacterized protein YxjI
MRYVMKQKLFTWGGDFTVKDADERDVYYVKGTAISLGKQLSFQDMNGTELAFIKQQIIAWTSEYDISHGGQIVAHVKEQFFTPFKHRFNVDGDGPNDLEIEGDFLDHEYVFRRGGTTVATLSKKWFTIADTYGIDIEDGEDPVLILACSVVVDEASARRHRRHH